MKGKVLAAALVVAALAAPAALASPPGGGKEGHHGARTGSHAGDSARAEKGCRPRVSFVLSGEYVAASADGGSFTLKVVRTNRHARVFGGKEVTVKVVADTKIKRRGHARLGDLVAGDRVLVQVRACKRADAASVELVAVRVHAQPKRHRRGKSETPSPEPTGSAPAPTHP
ncbi:MAG: hypothetical protein M3N47_08820 [Chloroflexota bacterium]|nr:hypothetical protein [Chloroflexota bacterium]